jgi:hypothetical protein
MKLRQNCIMKYIFILLLIAAVSNGNAQTRNDSIRSIQEALKYADLDFTAAETDSMIDNMIEFRDSYIKMHRVYPANELAFPFAFNPALGVKVPSKNVKIAWDVPNRTELPANKNDLAFYSIPQLSALILNKKISSVELTKFFINRLKKWGDTLQCVITLTEEMAMAQAKQADDELKQGIYRGPLHGIPFGIKDLFAVKGGIMRKAFAWCTCI